MGEVKGKDFREKGKKYLTNPRKHDRITKLSSEDRRWASGTKKDLKKSKKVLDKLERVW